MIILNGLEKNPAVGNRQQESGRALPAEANPELAEGGEGWRRAEE